MAAAIRSHPAAEPGPMDENASRSAQFIAFCIDIVVAVLAFWLMLGLVFLCEKIAGPLSTLSTKVALLLGTCLWVLHISLKDVYMWFGQSLGKKIHGIRIVDAKTLRPATKKQMSARPMLIFVILLALLMMGEKFSMTLVSVGWGVLPEQVYSLGAAALFLSVEFGLLLPRRDNRRIIDFFIGTRITVAGKK